MKTYTISVHEDHSGTEGKGSVVGVGGGKRMTGAGEDTRSDGGRPKKRIVAVKQGPRPSLRPPPQPRDGALPVSRGGRGGCRDVQRKRATSGRLMGKANSAGGKDRVFAQGQVGAGSTAGRKALEKLMTERKRFIRALSPLLQSTRTQADVSLPQVRWSVAGEGVWEGASQCSQETPSPAAEEMEFQGVVPAVVERETRVEAEHQGRVSRQAGSISITLDIICTVCIGTGCG